jgi:hypothetical protein
MSKKVPAGKKVQIIVRLVPKTTPRLNSNGDESFDIQACGSRLDNDGVWDLADHVRSYLRACVDAGVTDWESTL